MTVAASKSKECMVSMSWNPSFNPEPPQTLDPIPYTLNPGLAHDVGRALTASEPGFRVPGLGYRV